MLHLDNNELTSLPREIGQLSSLQEAAENDFEPLTEGLFLNRQSTSIPLSKIDRRWSAQRQESNVLGWLRGEFDPETSDAPSLETDPDDAAETDVDKGIFTQRPAAFRFGLRSGKIDALSETADATDSQTAHDLYEELRAKARGLADRLARANAHERVRGSVDRLPPQL